MSNDNTHAIENARGHLDAIIEAYGRVSTLREQDEPELAERVEDAMREQVLSVEVRSDWAPAGEMPAPAEFRILLSTGGPACAVFGTLDAHGEPDPYSLQICWQDWGTPWTPLPISRRTALLVRANNALDWLAGLFVYTT